MLIVTAMSMNQKAPLVSRPARSNTNHDCLDTLSAGLFTATEWLLCLWSRPTRARCHNETFHARHAPTIPLPGSSSRGQGVIDLCTIWAGHSFRSACWPVDLHVSSADMVVSARVPREALANEDSLLKRKAIKVKWWLDVHTPWG